MPDIVNKIELHYFFNDDNSHSISASIRNECENHLIKIFNEVIAELNIEVRIESEASQEGGFKEIWNFIGDSKGQLAIIISTLSLCVATAALNKDSEDPRLTEQKIINSQLEEEERRLDIEIKKIELRNLRVLEAEKEVEDEGDDLPEEKEVFEIAELRYIKHQNISLQDQLDIIIPIASKLSKNHKVAFHKSKFYTKLRYYPKVREISVTPLNSDNTPITKPFKVKQEEFPKFILNTYDLEDLIDESAIIELVAPILKDSKYQWKGIYNGETINFHMRDKKFKKSIQDQKVKFTTGMYIKCVLKSHQKLDDTGAIVIKKREVLVVLEIISDTATVTTSQGEKYLKNKTYQDSQLKIDFGA